MAIYEIVLGKHSIEYDTEAFKGKWRKEILKMKRREKDGKDKNPHQIQK